MRFVFEVEFTLDWSSPWFAVTYSPDHPKAAVEHAFARPERRADGTIERWVGVLLVRDMSSFHNPGLKQVVVARQAGKITELPEWAGALIGMFHTDHGQTGWYVFEARQQPEVGARVSPPEPPPAPPSPGVAPPGSPAPGSAPPAPARRPASTRPPAPSSPHPGQAAPADDDWLSGLS